MPKGSYHFWTALGSYAFKSPNRGNVHMLHRHLSRVEILCLQRWNYLSILFIYSFRWFCAQNSHCLREFAPSLSIVRIRFVTHHQICDDDVKHALEVIQLCLSPHFSSWCLHCSSPIGHVLIVDALTWFTGWKSHFRWSWLRLLQYLCGVPQRSDNANWLSSRLYISDALLKFCVRYFIHASMCDEDRLRHAQYGIVFALKRRVKNNEAQIVSIWYQKRNFHMLTWNRTNSMLCLMWMSWIKCTWYSWISHALHPLYPGCKVYELEWRYKLTFLKWYPLHWQPVLGLPILALSVGSNTWIKQALLLSRLQLTLGSHFVSTVGSLWCNPEGRTNNTNKCFKK